MNPTLQQCRQHYDTLPPGVRIRPTAKHLLMAIQIAEKLNEVIVFSQNYLNTKPLDRSYEADALRQALARVIKTEGK